MQRKLSKVSALSVAARNTAFTFKGKHVDAPQIARPPIREHPRFKAMVAAAEARLAQT
jgi:TolB-like protein